METTKDAITLEGDLKVEVVAEPVWELDAAELIFPQRILGQTVYVHMKPYTTYEMKELQAARATRMAVGSEYTDLKDSGKIEIIDFFWKHFLGLSGPGVSKIDKETKKEIRPTLQEAENFIRRNPRFDIERTTVLGGFGGVAIKDAEEGAVCLLDIAEEHGVAVYQDLYFPKLERIARVTMTHKLRPETEKDNRDYKQATENIRIMQRTRETIRVVNYDIFEILYNALIQEIDGMTIKGVPCSRNNKDEWVKAVPFWHKDFILTEYFRGAQVKNVQ